MQGVGARVTPVGDATLVYAGNQPRHPQSTALITVISIYTSSRHNQQQPPTGITS